MKLTHNERLVLIGLITDPAFAAKAIPMLSSKHFSVRFTRVVFEWCRDYIQAFNRPPGRAIQEIYTRTKEDRTQPEDLLELIEKFLLSISRELDNSTEKLSTEYLLAQLSEFVKIRELQEAQNSLGIALENDDLEEAESVLSKYSAVSLADIEHIQLGTMAAKVQQHIQDILTATHEKGLFTLPGALADLTGPLQKGDLVGIAGPAGRGKTWWLQEMGVLAAMAGNKVVLFSLEMSAPQILGRMAHRLTKAPRYPKTIQIPSFDAVGVTWEPKAFDVCLRHYDADSIQRKFSRLHVNGGDMVIQAYPAYSAGVQDLKSFLNYMESTAGYKADVVLIDYADIIRPDYKGEYRHQIDHIWKTLRGLTQEKDFLGITATHTNKKTFEKNIGQADMSEEARKLNHVALMLGLNQTPVDKKNGIMRATLLKSRHDGFNVNDEVIVLQCLDIGCPILDSRHKTDVPNYEDIKERAQND